MHGATDLLRARLWRAILRRRVPLWVASGLPLLAARLLLPADHGLSAAALLLWAAWLAFDLLRWRGRIARNWTAWLDAAVPALEDSSRLLVATPASAIAALQQQRLRARLAQVLNDDHYRAIARTRARFTVLPPLASLLAASVIWAMQLQPAPPAGPQQAGRQPGAAGAIADGVPYLRVTPPAYTGVAAFESAARDIQVPQFAEVRWCVRKPRGVPAVVELSDGQMLEVTPQCALWRAGESLFWRQRGAGGSRYNIRVVPDQAPQITISAPRELIQLLTPVASSVQLAVSVRDDYAVTRASLHLTLARGSGENVRFSDREVPLPQGADARQRNWQKQWTLAELGMVPGDELYFFVRASDNAPEHPHTTQSPTYTLRLPGPEAESLDASALPSMVKPENLRSQRQIIIDTEQLLADLQAHPGMAAPVLRARSESIAADQAGLRLRYGQFLGEESSLFGDEHEHEHEQGSGRAVAQFGNAAAVIAEYGHAHDQEDNATIFDPKTKAVLKRALSAMWEAEKSLRAITPRGAIAPEYKALDAIKELQQAERVYLHRTAFVPPALREEKRMSGDMVGALSYKRAQGAASALVPAELRAVIEALSQEVPLPALWSKVARDAIASGIADQEHKLAAQRAVQDVQDGCAPCRAELRAWLRSTLNDAPVLLQAVPATQTPFGQAWRGKEQP